MSATKVTRYRPLLYFSWSNTDDVGNVTSGTKVRTLAVDNTVLFSDNVPGWHDKIARGVSATTGMEGTRYTLSGGEGYLWSKAKPITHSLRTGYGSGTIMMDSYSFPNPYTSISATADQKATSKLLQSYINGRSVWRGGNFLAEVLETVRLFTRPAKAFEHATADFFKKIAKVHNLAESQRLSPKNIAKVIGSTWLAYKFVAKPLASDCNDAAEAYADLTLGGRHDSFPVKGKGKETGIVPGSQVLSFVSAPPVNLLIGTWRYEKHDEYEYTVRYKGAIKAEPSPVGDVLPRFGMDVWDVLPAVWEAVPYSFLIDYFINCNEALDAMRLWNVIPAWLNKTTRNVMSRAYSSPFGPSSDASATQTGGTRPAVLRATYVKRSVVSTMPYPSLHFQLPSFWQKANIAALIAAKGKHSR